MQRDRREPFGNMHFRVDIEGMDEGGAIEVVLPQGRITTTATTGPPPVDYGSLVIRRGLTLSRGWYAWWHACREAVPAPTRRVSVTLLSAAGEDVHCWTFADAEPLGYQVSALNSRGNEPVVETLELKVRSFEMT